MALAQYNYPQATGLQQLGDVLMKSSGDYANIQLRRQAEERRRAQQLADLQDSRQFAVDQRGIERRLMLEDEERRRVQAVDDATLSVLLKEGWLKPTDAKNPGAITAAADARQARLSVTRERDGKLPDKLQQEADYLGKQDVELAAAESALNAKLSEPEPGPPSPAEVRVLAIRMLNKAPGVVPTDVEINDAMPGAQAAIMQDRFLRWSMGKEDAKNQVQLLRSQRTALRQSLGALLQQGFVPNRAPPSSPSSSLSAPAPALRPATAAEADEAAGVTPPPDTNTSVVPVSSGGYGGLMGLAGRVTEEIPALRAALSDPGGAGQVFARSAFAVPERYLNRLFGGEKRVQEREAGRAAEMLRAESEFILPPRVPAAAFSPGAFSPPSAPVISPSVALGPLYPQVPNYGGGMRNMTDTEKQSYDINQQAKKTGGYLFRGF